MRRNKHLGSSLGEMTVAMLRRDRRLADALLQEAVQALLSGETPVARALIRDVIKGTIGYGQLSRRTGTPEASLVRMFGPNGNPTAANLFNVLTQLQAKNRVQFEVRLVRKRATRAAPRARAPARRAA